MMLDLAPTPQLSVVVPMHNEAENVRPLHQRLSAALADLGRAFEILYVDDGSSDATLDRLVETLHEDESVRVLKLSANFGLTAALRAGFEAARGDVVVALDGDLQNDPADLPAFLQKLDEGCDLVCGWRRVRRDGFWAKRLPSLLGNAFARLWLVMPVHDTGCTLKAMRSDLAKRLPLRRGFHRFIPSLASVFDARTAEVVVRHHPRLQGRSKYNWTRTIDVLADMVVLSFLIAYLRPRSPLLSWNTLQLALGLLLSAAIVGQLAFGGPDPFDAVLAYAVVFWVPAALIVQGRDRFLNPPRTKALLAPTAAGRAARRLVQAMGLAAAFASALAWLGLPLIWIASRGGSLDRLDPAEWCSGAASVTLLFGCWLVGELTLLTLFGFVEDPVEAEIRRDFLPASRPNP
jgi:hypothetical protein